MVLVVCWVALGYVLLDETSVPPDVEAFGIGALGVGLCALGVTMGAVGFRSLLRDEEHYHPDSKVRHTHWFLQGPRSDEADADAGDHPHGFAGYLTIGVVGAVFTLSPPISMIVFISGVAPRAEAGDVALVVLAYASAIVGSMTVIGTGSGRLFSAVRAHGPRVHAAVQLVAAVLVFGYGLRFLWQGLT